ncbi:putative signal peptide-containing protein [Cryptosporidium hominis]
MFNYLKLFLIFAALCNLLSLLPDQVFFNHLSNTSINPNFVSKYSYVKLKSGFVRPLAQAANRGASSTGSLFRGISQSHAGGSGRSVFQPGPQGSPNTGLRHPLGSSQAVARAISRALGTSPSSSSRFIGSSSGANPRANIGAASQDLRGSTSAGSSIFPRSPSSTQNLQSRNFGLQSHHRGSHSATGAASAPSRYGPGFPPLTRPVGYLSVPCPNNPNSNHFLKPGNGKRQHCQYCD